MNKDRLVTNELPSPMYDPRESTSFGSPNTKAYGSLDRNTHSESFSAPAQYIDKIVDEIKGTANLLGQLALLVSPVSDNREQPTGPKELAATPETAGSLYPVTDLEQNLHNILEEQENNNRMLLRIMQRIRL